MAKLRNRSSYRNLKISRAYLTQILSVIVLEVSRSTAVVVAHSKRTTSRTTRCPNPLNKCYNSQSIRHFRSMAITMLPAIRARNPSNKASKDTRCHRNSHSHRSLVYPTSGIWSLPTIVPGVKMPTDLRPKLTSNRTIIKRRVPTRHSSSRASPTHPKRLNNRETKWVKTKCLRGVVLQTRIKRKRYSLNLLRMLKSTHSPSLNRKYNNKKKKTKRRIVTQGSLSQSPQRTPLPWPLKTKMKPLQPRLLHNNCKKVRKNLMS